MTPAPIETAPKAQTETEEPITLLLYCPTQSGWQTGAWYGRKWHAVIDLTLELEPTHWLPCPPQPERPADE